ncbi:MAG: tetratricopeptide repeat protein [Candidatus Hodarchaeota archaeon]
MARGLEEALDNLHQAEQLMTEGRVDEARSLINALEAVEGLPPDDHLTFQLLKSQMHLEAREWEVSRQLAEQVWQESQNQDNSLFGVDAQLITAEALRGLGQYEESLNTVVEGEQLLANLPGVPPAVLAQREAAYLHLRGRIYRSRGDFKQAMEYLQQSLAIRQKFGNKFDIAVTMRRIGTMHSLKGDSDLAIDFTQQALDIFQEIGNKRYIALCLTNIGGFLWQSTGEWARAIEYCQQGLALFQEIGNRSWIAYAQGQLNNLYAAKGEWNQALAFYQQNLSIAEETGHKWGISNASRAVANIYLHQGELDQALFYAQKSLAIAKEHEIENFVAYDLNIIGQIQWAKGMLDKALTSLEESVKFKTGSHSMHIEALFWLVIVSLDGSSPEQAQQYLHRLQELNEQRENRQTSLCYRVAKALMLKRNPRIRDKANAQELFQQVTEEEVFFAPVTQIAIVNLCELLLDELKAYGEETVLLEAQTLAGRLYDLAQEQSSFSVVVNALILQAKLALVAGNLATAVQLLEQAHLMADEKGLGLLADRVKVERQQLEAQYDTWNRLIRDNASFKERLDHTRLIDYLKTAQRFMSLETRE